MGYYSYVDDTGYPKHVSYVADDFGFRITNANNFPVAPVAQSDLPIFIFLLKVNTFRTITR